MDTGSAKNVRYIRTPIGTKLKLLHCRMCSGQKSVTILQNYYAKFGAASTPTEDRVECDGEYEGNSTYFSTPISIISKYSNRRFMSFLMFFSAFNCDSKCASKKLVTLIIKFSNYLTSIVLQSVS